MFKDMITVMDFGSSKITVLAGIKEVNNSFKLLASSDCEYDGFANGEFIDSNSLQSAMSTAINDVERQLQCKVRTIYIGVPAEFCFATENVLTKSFGKKIKIKPKVVDSLFENDSEDLRFPTHTLINKSPMYYVINDENKTNDPIGLIATKIAVRTSYVFVENEFKMLISGILHSIGIKDYDFLSNSLSEGIYLIDENSRNEGALIVDCGYITTSVVQMLGDGIKDMKSFSLGGGFITADLSRVLEITYEEAEELKMQAVVTLKGSGIDQYEISTGKKFSVKTVNEIILARVDKIVSMIKKCLESFEMQLPDYISLCITGGGLNYIEGMKDYLRKEFDRPIEFVAPSALLYRKPDLSSSISLLELALNL